MPERWDPIKFEMREPDNITTDGSGLELGVAIIGVSDGAFMGWVSRVDRHIVAGKLSAGHSVRGTFIKVREFPWNGVGGTAYAGLVTFVDEDIKK